MYRRYRTPSMYRELLRMQNEMDRLFRTTSPVSGHRVSTFPPMNIWSDEENAMITAEMPGVDKKDLDISVTGDTLTISGKRQPDELPEDAKYHRRERSYGEFNRSIQLPYTVDVDKVNADFSQGVLKVMLPRIESEKPKKITVKAS